MLKVFVYGTLKKGQRNHDYYCRGVASVEPATVRGRLYDLPNGNPALGLSYGYPALVVPEEDIFALGTANYEDDARVGAAVFLPGVANVPGSWDMVQGDLLTFQDPEDRLPALDTLEAYDPRSSRSGPYRRVLVRATLDGARDDGLAAWTYAVGEAVGDYLPGGIWTA